MTDIGSNITWTRKLEHYFSSTGERANCMSWSHAQAEKIFSFRTTLIDLPVIVLSSVTGFLSVGSATLFQGAGSSASSALGAVSLFVAVLNTLGTYFSWSKRAEAHRIASIHFAKLYRFISVEMSLPREERTTPSEFLKYTKEQYDHLNEMSPALPEEVVKSFHRMFNDEDLKDISVPEQMNGLEAIHVYDDSDLRNDLELEMKTKTLEVEHSNNIDKIPGLGRQDASFRRDSILTVAPMPPMPQSPQVPQLPPQVPVAPVAAQVPVPPQVPPQVAPVPSQVPPQVPQLLTSLQELNEVDETVVEAPVISPVIPTYEAVDWAPNAPLPESRPETPPDSPKETPVYDPNGMD